MARTVIYRARLREQEAFERGRAEGVDAAFTAMESDEALEAAESAWHNGPGTMRAVLAAAVLAARAITEGEVRA